MAAAPIEGTSRGAAPSSRDTAAPPRDTAAPPRDAAARSRDAAAPSRDAAAPSRDAAAPAGDAAAPPSDPAAPSSDAAARLRLKITEVFHSIQGEALHTGWPTVFVRLTGCPLRCRYCDTAYAFGGGNWWTCGEILERVGSFGARHVCVTGGEPLAQSRCLALLEMLCDAGYEVCLETGGAHDIGPVDSRVSRIVDVKTPGSGECDRNRLENLALLTSRDALKIVVTSRADYEWARSFVRTHPVPCPIFLSPSFNELPAADLADWILEDRLPVRLQLQLHKTLWGDTPGR